MNIAVMGGAIGQANNCLVRVGKKVEDTKREKNNCAKKRRHELGKRVNAISTVIGNHLVENGALIEQ